MRKYKLYSSITLLALGISGMAQITPTQSENYIFVQEPVMETTNMADIDNDSIIQAIQYFDGLGRPKQNVLVRGTNTKKDIVTKIEYDGFGRQVVDFLPVPTTQQNGQFVNPSGINGNHYLTTYGDSTWYSEKTLENSPLNRVMKQAAPGDDWAKGGGHEIEFAYQTNNQNEVRLFKVNSSGQLIEQGKYDAGQLYKTITTDENGEKIYEFKDKQGRVVLKRSSVAHTLYPNPKPIVIAEANEQVDTYYVYDIYSNLTFVIPPLLAKKATISQSLIDELGYQYKYDDRNRLIEKKLPGKGWEYMVYDNQDRLVATQDANLKAQNKWLFTKYDKFGRMVYTGIFQDSSNRDAVQNLVNTYGNNNEKRSSGFSSNGNTISYTNNIFPTNFSEILTVNYYDTYEDYNMDPAYLENTKGMPTTTHVKVIDANQWEKVQTGYDAKGRPVFTYKANHLGGHTEVKTDLDFRGKPTQVITKHKRNSNGVEVKTTEQFSYDHQERLLTHSHQINDGQVNYLSRNSYDKLGQLTNKKVGGVQANGNDRWQNVNYKYNIRGWLTEINSNNLALLGNKALPTSTNDGLFSFKIHYNELNEDAENDFVNKLYNGNIAQAFWKTGSDNTERGYNYTYDQLNRLRRADFYKKGNPGIEAYGEFISYDLNGNITKLYRTTGDAQDNEIEMDDLLYEYYTDSNKLKNVSDAVSSGNTGGFVDGNTNPALADYEYDQNGNMVKDRNKGITNISYNHLNLPTEIIFDNTHKITYLYNALGQKLKKTVIDGNENKVVDYLDGFQYAGNVLQFFPTAEGYVNVIDDSFSSIRSFDYVFNYTDHLGNIRLSYTKNPQTGVLEILDETHYYPFGLKHEVYIPALKQNFILDQSTARGALTNVTETDYQYKYNGKEWQDELGLNFYDYGARNYDPTIGRWMNMDPLAEKFMDVSPYNYALNNPVFFIDPDGMEAQVSVDTDQLEETTRLVNIGYDRVVSANSFGGSFSGSYTSIFESNEDNNQNPNNGEPKNGGKVKNNNSLEEDGLFTETNCDCIKFKQIGINKVVAINNINDYFPVPTRQGYIDIEWKMTRELFISIPNETHQGLNHKPKRIAVDAIEAGFAMVSATIIMQGGNFNQYKSERLFLKTVDSYLRASGGSATLNKPNGFNEKASEFSRTIKWFNSCN